MYTQTSSTATGQVIDSVARIFVNLGTMNKLRNKVLYDTLARLYSSEERERYRTIALENVESWAVDTKLEKQSEVKIIVVADDWGVATQRLSREYGQVFAVLNMANAYVFGGGYLDGMVAQEENMFRRTDCHFSHPKNLLQSENEEFNPSKLIQRLYTKEEHALVDGFNNDLKVYIDLTPRVCIKGPEAVGKRDENGVPVLGYELLDEKDIFPFLELRSAALDLRSRIDPDKVKALNKNIQFAVGDLPGSKIMRQKIIAQLETLMENNIKHVVLSAFGCGAFLNDAQVISKLYHEEIFKRKEFFEVIAFAIYYPGYGVDNYTPFLKEFSTGT